MNPFTKISFTPNFRLGHVIEWKLDPLFRVELPYTFTVQIAETPDFSTITAELDATDQYFAVDKTNTKRTLGDVTVYRIKLVSGDNTYYSQSIMFGAQNASTRNYLLAAEIQRKELLRISRYVPSQGWLLKRKTYGSPAVDNISFVTGQPIADNVGDYGTGLVDGYYAPLGFMWSLDQQTQNRGLKEQMVDVVEDYSLSIRTIGYPSLEVRDIIIDADTDLRYSIESHTSNVFPGTNIPLIQTAVLKELTPSDTIYQFPIPTKYINAHVL